MSEIYENGVFRGRKTVQRKAEVGGARSVFVKLQGNKNELVYPTFGGQIKNPFKGPAKLFAGDLMEYRTDENGLNPEIYILKTYLVHSADGDVINFVNDGYKHTPFVGDKVAKESGLAVTIAKVEVSTEDNVKVWKCTLTNAGPSFSKGDVLVECDKNNEFYVQNVNAVAPTDLDMFDAPATGDEDFDGARYFYTPALGGLMYTNKMQPLPEYVKEFNKSEVNGWFKIQSV